MFKKFLSLFISQAPWRFVYVVLVISIISMGSYAYQNAGDVIGLKASASSDISYTKESAVTAANNWIYAQTCFGDRINPGTLNMTFNGVGIGSYEAMATFSALDYKIDMETGALHHLSANHTVNMHIVNGRVVSATEGFRDLVRYQISGPVASVEEELF